VSSLRRSCAWLLCRSVRAWAELGSVIDIVQPVQPWRAVRLLRPRRRRLRCLHLRTWEFLFPSSSPADRRSLHAAVVGSPATGPSDGCSLQSGSNRDCCYYFAANGLQYNGDNSVSLSQDSCSHCLSIGVCPTSNSYTGTPKGLWTCNAGGSTDSYNGASIKYCKATLSGGGIALVVVLVVVGVAGCAGLAVFAARRRRAMQAKLSAVYPGMQVGAVGVVTPPQVYGMPPYQGQPMVQQYPSVMGPP